MAHFFDKIRSKRRSLSWTLMIRFWMVLRRCFCSSSWLLDLVVVLDDCFRGDWGTLEEEEKEDDVFSGLVPLKTRPPSTPTRCRTASFHRPPRTSCCAMISLRWSAAGASELIYLRVQAGAKQGQGEAIRDQSEAIRGQNRAI